MDAEDLDVFVQPRVHSWFQDDTLKTLGDISAIRSKYDLSLYEFGIDYNEGIRVAFQNGWNRGSRISIYPFYFQGMSSLCLHYLTPPIVVVVYRCCCEALFLDPFLH